MCTAKKTNMTAQKVSEGRGVEVLTITKLTSGSLNSVRFFNRKIINTILSTN